jgi:hypothetical protein
MTARTNPAGCSSAARTTPNARRGPPSLCWPGRDRGETTVHDVEIPGSEGGLIVIELDKSADVPLVADEAAHARLIRLLQVVKAVIGHKMGYRAFAITILS